MNYIDVIILTIVAYFAFLGFRRGIIKEISSLLALFLGAYAAIFFSQQINYLLNDLKLVEKNLVPAISFALFFILTYFIVRILGSIIDKLFKIMALGFFTRIFGAVFGVLKSLIILSFFWFIIGSYCSIDEKMKSESVLLEHVEKTLKSIHSNAKNYSEKDFKTLTPGNSLPSK